jgi:hypothetical protein
VREGAERLGPDDAKVPNASEVSELGEDAVEDVAEKVAAKARYDGLASFVAGNVSG